MAKRKRGVAGSSVGKKLFNSYLDKDTKKLFRALLVIVERDRGKAQSKVDFIFRSSIYISVREKSCI